MFSFALFAPFAVQGCCAVVRWAASHRAKETGERPGGRPCPAIPPPPRGGRVDAPSFPRVARRPPCGGHRSTCGYNPPPRWGGDPPAFAWRLRRAYGFVTRLRLAATAGRWLSHPPSPGGYGGPMAQSPAFARRLRRADGSVTCRCYNSYGLLQIRRKFGPENDEKDQIQCSRDQVLSKNGKDLLTHLNISVANRPWRCRKGRSGRPRPPFSGGARKAAFQKCIPRRVPYSPKLVPTPRATARSGWSGGMRRLPPAASSMATSESRPSCQDAMRFHRPPDTSSAAR